MLEVALQNVSLGVLRDVSVVFPKSTHTAIVGLPASGASTLLRIIDGQARPASGNVRFGARDVTSLSAARRPMLSVTANVDAPARWSVRHLLVAAARQRTLDRQDRQREFALAVTKWQLDDLLERRLRSLSGSERTRANLARIELLRPGIVVADRLLEELNASALTRTADDLYRTLRVIGATVISSPCSFVELGLADRVVVIDRGRVIQDGVPSHVYRHPVNESAAQATGETNVIPIDIRGTTVRSPVGAWELGSPRFEGTGVALARPEDFTIVGPGEESDLIFGIEEASFREGRWEATGVLSGGVTLRVSLPGDTAVQKGRLLPLRFDATRFTLISQELSVFSGIPTDIIPPLRDSR